MTSSVQTLSERIRNNIGRVIVGKDDLIEKIIISCFCSGHVLLEDIPGTGKTTLAKALAKSVGCDFKRVQFTPDLLPSDVTGINFYHQKQEEFLLKKGPVFTDILLADEINRATPRTQSSLLECMEERQVTIDGVTYPLSPLFLVIATQNPVETQGTFPLPEAQLDRFFMRLSMGYPAPESERDILTHFMENSPLDSLSSVASADELLTAQREIRAVRVSDPVKDYLIAIVNATRSHPEIRLGVSPRGALALMRASQGHAGVNGRDYVLPDDVKAVCGDVLPHRMICKGANLLRQTGSADAVLKEILGSVPVPAE